MTQLEMELLTKVLGYLIAGIFIYMIKPLVEALVKKYQNNEVVEFTIKAIRAAQQEIGKGACGEKKNIVLNQVASYVNDHTSLTLSGEEINTIIEGSMKEAKEIYENEKKDVE